MRAPEVRVDVALQGGASAATVRGLIDSAAETIAAAGCDDPRADAEALVADVLGVTRGRVEYHPAGGRQVRSKRNRGSCDLSWPPFLRAEAAA